jgi:glycine/D-amino acid oxidase-like deaminating enzyme
MVLEARRVGRQVTGRSTAKLTSQHSLIYQHLRNTFDLDTARLYAEANRAGVEQIRTWVHELATYILQRGQAIGLMLVSGA